VEQYYTERCDFAKREYVAGCYGMTVVDDEGGPKR
jgi:hypothetical protein